MNKRLRKKLLKGEYEVYGFHIEFTTKDKLEWFTGPNNDLDGPGMQFADRLCEWGLLHGIDIFPCGDGKRWGAFIVPMVKGVPYPGLSRADRDMIVDHIKALPEVDKVVVGEVVDVMANNVKQWQDFCNLTDEAFGPIPVYGAK